MYETATTKTALIKFHDLEFKKTERETKTPLLRKCAVQHFQMYTKAIES